MTPMMMQWTGDSFRPVNSHFAGLADQELVVGERYRVTTLEERSARTHNHFFACVADGWRNLPDDKKMLIRAGYCDETTITCASKAEALRAALHLWDIDTYAVVVPRGDVVSIYRAKSQSLKAMGKKEFQKSKDAVLELIDGLLGTEPGTLAKQGEVG
jgi:hypothetical protein